MMNAAKNVSPSQAREWVANGEAILIDVRDPDEFNGGHIPYAMSIPLAELEHAFHHLDLPPSRKVIFQCLRGTRGEKACALISQSANNCDIYNLDGGIEAWNNEGLPVAGRQSGPKISIFRQVQIIVGGLVAVLVSIGLMGLSFALFIAGFLGVALFFAGVTGWCGLAMLLNKAPWNRR